MIIKIIHPNYKVEKYYFSQIFGTEYYPIVKEMINDNVKIRTYNGKTIIIED